MMAGTIGSSVIQMSIGGGIRYPSGSAHLVTSVLLSQQEKQSSRLFAATENGAPRSGLLWPGRGFSLTTGNWLLTTALSGAHLRQDGVHHVEGMLRGEDLLQRLFELLLGLDRPGSIQICQCQGIKIDEVRDLEQLEPVVERGRSNIEVMDESIARGLGDDFALHQLARLLAQQRGLLFQDGGRRGQVGVGNVRRPIIVAVRHRALLQNSAPASPADGPTWSLCRAARPPATAKNPG